MTIKELRTACGMTQKAFAEYFSIPKRSIENWEGGTRNAPEYLIELMQYKLRKEGLIWPLFLAKNQIVDQAFLFCNQSIKL